MARIRTIKPEFYRHEELIELEIQYPGLRPMIVFSALWGHCDKNGVFEWKPRSLQLDILPFFWEAMGKCLVTSLLLLVEHNFIKTYSKDGKIYGHIPTFKVHQSIGGKELQSASRNPEVANMTEYSMSEEIEKHLRSNGEVPGKEPGPQEGKGREGNLESLKEGDDSPLKPDELIWQIGLKMLTDKNVSPDNARRILGKHCKTDKTKLATVIAQMSISPPIDPVAYLQKAMQPDKPERPAYMKGVR